VTVEAPVSRVRAALCYAFGEPWQVEQVDLRPAAAGEVGVRVAACAICHSDLAYSRGAWGGHLPAVYGHEVAGVVDELGEGVDGMRVGDHVVVTLIRACGRCATCLRGLPALCERRGSLAADERWPLRLPGGEPVHQALRTAGFAERVVVDLSQVVPVPSAIDLQAASLLGCGVLTGVGAVLTTAAVEAGSSVCVVGLGGVGLNAVQGAALAGAGLIAGVDPMAAKREAALELGAAVVSAPGDEAALAATGGRGFDTVVVTAPSGPAAEAALQLLADAGALVLVGMPSGARVSIDPEQVAERGLRILGSKVGSARPQLDVARLASLYQGGRLQLDRLITHRLPLDLINEGIEAAESGEALKVVIVP
jgi:Zn-dependent alcohol dehydrogenase